jgi:hypothetical protein
MFFDNYRKKVSEARFLRLYITVNSANNNCEQLASYKM